MPSKLVTLATFNQSFEADIARATLRAHGIRAFVPDAHFSTLSPMHVAAMGGVRLQVAQADEARAALVLNQPPPSADEIDALDEAFEDEPPELRCPSCEGTYVYFEWPFGLVLLSIVLLGLPLLFIKKKWQCRKCGHAFAAPPPAAPVVGSPYRRPRRRSVARAG